MLFLTSSAPRFPGDPTAPFILNMARDLCDLGWSVDILAPHAPGLKKEEVIDGVSIRRFQYLWPASFQSLCYNGGATVNLRRHKLRAVTVPFFVCAQLFATLSWLIRKRPSLIHSHWAIPQGVIGQILSLTGIPHVISIHGTDIYGLRGRLMTAIKAWALRHCEHVITNSTSTRAEVEALCCPRAISVIPTGSTPAPSAAKPPALASARTILFVGRLIEAKGARYLIQALPHIMKVHPVRVLIVGDGPERPALQRLSEGLGIQNHIDFVGLVPHSRIYDYFSLADVFVGPSIALAGVSNEAQGNTFVEALFARVPVVASRVGGIPDAIVEGCTGLLVDERSPDQIAEAVLRILNDPALAEALKEAGYRHAEKNFSRFTNAGRISAVYEALLRSAE